MAYEWEDPRNWLQEMDPSVLERVSRQPAGKRRTWIARGAIKAAHQSRRQKLLDEANKPMQMRQQYLQNQMPMSDREKMGATFGQQDRLALLGQQGRSQAATTAFGRDVMMNQLTNQQGMGAAQQRQDWSVRAADVASQRGITAAGVGREFTAGQNRLSREKLPAPQFDVFQGGQGGDQFYQPRGGEIPAGATRVSPSPVNISFGPKERPSPSERAEIRDARKSISALDNLKMLMDSDFVGPITGRVAPYTGLLGLTSDQQESFMAATAAFKNAIIEQITGAQMGEEEADRILQQVPLPTDPPARWKAKWEQSKLNVLFLLEEQRKVLRQSGMMVPGETPLPWDSQQGVGDMSTEELLNALRQMQ